MGEASGQIDLSRDPQMDGADEETAVQDFLQILEEHRRNCERQGKYVEAEIAKNRIEELRRHEENRRLDKMRTRQIAERLGVEEAHMMEFQQFNALWDKKMAEYEQKALDLHDAMKERHAAEYTELQNQLHAQNVRDRPKYSKELLNLRKIQETLAKQKQYAEAHKVQQKADQLEALERSQFDELRKSKSNNKLQQLSHKHAQEMAALKKRIQAGREEQKKQRQLDLER
mmetsp:Transcript_15650/g.39730  ORF Transcript_15650/g.39730 Transcript_15650/m.39730 type:complete len:229 (+) Transcript_15650:222-908(+)